MTRRISILVASDGSSAARAAVSLAGRMPWPRNTRATGVVAAEVPGMGLGPLYRTMLLESYRTEARRLDAFLRKRFLESRVSLVEKPPPDAILGEQRRQQAQVIVVGSRGLGALTRVALGSVSRRLVRDAPCPVLVTKRVPRSVRRFVVAFDGSAASHRGVRFVERLDASAGGHVLLVEVVSPVPTPQMARVPATVRFEVLQQLALQRSRREAAARRRLDKAAKRLRQAGWKVTTDVPRGTAVVEILKAASSWRADVLVCGATGTRGLHRLLLGSVAEGLLARSPVSVLVAK